MHPALTFAVFALAVARLSVLVVEDKIVERPREWLLGKIRQRFIWGDFDKTAAELQAVHDEIARTPPDQSALLDALEGHREALGVHLDNLGEAANTADDPYLAYLLKCQWCVSVWIGLPAVIVWWNWPDSPWSLGPAVLLAFSMIAGKLSQMGD